MKCSKKNYILYQTKIIYYIKQKIGHFRKLSKFIVLNFVIPKNLFHKSFRNASNAYKHTCRVSIYINL